MKEALRLKVVRAAEQRGVSMNAEIVERLQNSFAAADLRAIFADELRRALKHYPAPPAADPALVAAMSAQLAKFKKDRPKRSKPRKRPA